MGRDRAFSQAEAEFVASYVSLKPTAWIAERLGRTTHAIRAWVRRHPDLWTNRRRVQNRRAKAAPDGYRYCRRCERVLPIADFYGDRGHRSGLQTRCKRCSVEVATQWNLAHKDRFHATSERSRLRRKYGLEPAAFENLLILQRGLCPICEGILDGRIAVDHDHGTGQVRGLLHPRCNSALGALGDSIESLQRAIAYLNQE